MIYGESANSTSVKSDRLIDDFIKELRNDLSSSKTSNKNQEIVLIFVDPINKDFELVLAEVIFQKKKF